MRRRRIGIAIDGERVVLVEEGDHGVRVTREGTCDAENWADAFLALLTGGGTPAAREEVAVYVLDARVRMRRLFGVAADTPPSEIATAVAQRPSEFFLGEDVHLVAARPELVEGVWWGAAFDRTLVDAIRRATAARRATLAWIAPRPPRAAADESQDAAIEAAALAIERGRAPALSLVEGSTSAFGGRALSLGVPLCVFVLGVLGATFGPTLVYRARTEEARAQLRALETSNRGRIPSALEAAGEASAALLSSNPAASAVVAQLVLALPTSSLITSLRLDTSRVELSVLVAPSTDVVSALARNPGVADLRLTAPISRERWAEMEFNRVSATFRYTGR